jgi:hypothetical protein
MWKSAKIMMSLLADLKIAEIDIIAVQKLYKRQDIIAIYCSHSYRFWPVYLVNKRILSYC